MLKSQYVILTISVLAVIALAFLPKVVVNDEDRMLQKQETSSEGASSSNGQVQPHGASLDAESQKELEELKATLSAAQDYKEALDATNRISSLFGLYGRYDSAAYYYAQLADKQGAEEAKFNAGKMFYEAMMVSLSAEEMQANASQVQKYLSGLVNNGTYQSDAKVMLGMTYMQTENPMQGVMMLREVLNENPEHKGALLNLGLLSMQSGQMDKAVERFEKLKSLDINDTKARFYLGIAYFETNQPDKALIELNFAKENSTDPQVLSTVEGLLGQLATTSR